MKILALALALAGFSTGALAGHGDFTLVRNSDGQSFTCSTGNGGGGPVDQSCVEQVTDYCYKVTSWNRNVCFEKATKGCRGGYSGLASCVKDTEAYCYSNTSYNHNDCFDRAVNTCGGGSPRAAVDLMEAVKAGARLEAKGIELESLK